MFMSMAELIDDLEYEQKEEKIKTMMNMMTNMNTAKRVGQVEVNNSSGLGFEHSWVYFKVSDLSEAWRIFKPKQRKN